MTNKIYLLGGADIKKGESKEIDKEAFANADNKNILVLNLTTNDKERLENYRIFSTDYFKNLGATNIVFINELYDDIEKQFHNSGLLYIPGGNTELLMKKIKEKNLEDFILKYRGVIVGNSAGAMVLCDEAICAYEGRKIMKGLDLLDLRIDVHYNESHNKKLLELSNNREIYAIPEKSVVIIDGKDKSFIGDVYLFSKGEKTKVN